MGFVIPSVRGVYRKNSWISSRIMFYLTVFLAVNVTPENTLYHTCIITSKPGTWVGIFAPQVRSMLLHCWLLTQVSFSAIQVAYAVFTVILTIANATDRPRKNHTQIIEDLWRDGVTFYLVRPIPCIVEHRQLTPGAGITWQECFIHLCLLLPYIARCRPSSR
jgi:hypothetical protein